MKMFVSMLSTETNTFSPLPTGLNIWKDLVLVHRDEPVKSLVNPEAFLGTAPKDRGWELTRGLLALAYPAGLIPRGVYESLRNELLADLKAAMPVDAVSLILHGAMVAEGYDDCEGDVLARVREIVGPDVAVGAELDLHCNISPEMLHYADVLIGYKEYPHTDILQRWIELFHVMADTAEGKIKPVMSSFDCRMIGMYYTTDEPLYSLVREMEELEKQEQIISVWVAHCFPWSDVPFIGTRTVVVTDDNLELAKETAERLGRKVFAMREEVASRPDTIDETLAKALASEQGPIVIADTGDNPGGGAPCDSTFFLETMIERGIENAGLAAIWDPVAVTVCQDGGVGTRLQLRIGGKMGPSSGNPIDVSATVIGLADNVTQQYGGVVMSLGQCAAVKVHLNGESDKAPEKGIDVVLVQRRVQIANPNVFTDLGIDPTRKKILIVKSTQHFHAAFRPIAKGIFYAGDKGTLQNDVTKIPYQRLDKNRYWPFVKEPFVVG